MTYSGPSQTSMMEYFSENVELFSQKSPIIDACQDVKYGSQSELNIIKKSATSFM